MNPPVTPPAHPPVPDAPPAPLPYPAADRPDRTEPATLEDLALPPGGSSKRPAFWTSWWALGVLALVLSAIHFNGLGVPPLAGTEGHRVVTAHQMNERGEYLIPRLYGFPYLLKPPLYYWTLAAFESAFGSNAWVWRSTSVVCHLLTLTACFAFARRWFGPPAGTVAGFGFVLTVGLWQEARTSDIDGLNTFVSSLAALGLTHLLLRAPGSPAGRSGSPVRRAAVVALTAVALGAALLAKLPAVIPALLVPLVGTVIVSGGPRALLRRDLALVAAGGAAIFLAWAVPLKLAMRGRQTSMDNEGLTQAARSLVPDSASELFGALLVPGMLWAYALPASVAVVLAFHPVLWGRRRDIGTPERVTSVLAAGLVASWLLFMLAGSSNPRYAYVTLPLVGVLAGGVFSRLWREPFGRAAAGWTLVGSAVALTIAGVVLVLQSARLRQYGPVPAADWAALVLAAVTAAVVIVLVRRERPVLASTAILLIAVFVGEPFSEYCNRRRDLKSGIHAARLLDKLLAPDQTVAVGSLLYFQPEIFWYLDRPVTATGRRSLERPGAFVPGRVYLLDRLEYESLRTSPAGPDARVHPFRSNGAPCYAVWTAPAPAAIPTSP